MNRRLIARVGIWLMYGLILLVVWLLGHHEIPPLLALGTAVWAALAIGGFRYYLTRGSR